jgi:quercetin dioxygenase-like cupin family protein
MPESVARHVEYRDDGPLTRKLAETDRTIVTLVCLKPGQVIPPFTHRRREAFVYVLEGAVRISPGDGPAELGRGDLASYDGSKEASPRNPGRENAAFLVTLVRKRGD